jgi:hypothetical protein
MYYSSSTYVHQTPSNLSHHYQKEPSGRARQPNANKALQRYSSPLPDVLENGIYLNVGSKRFLSGSVIRLHATNKLRLYLYHLLD